MQWPLATSGLEGAVASSRDGPARPQAFQVALPQTYGISGELDPNLRPVRARVSGRRGGQPQLRRVSRRRGQSARVRRRL